MPQNHYGMGVAVGDYDNDGFADLYVTNYGGNTLYRNAATARSPTSRSAPASAAARLERQRGVLRLRQRRPARPVRHALRRLELREQPLLRREEARLPRLLPPRQLRWRRQHPLPQQRRRHVHRRLGEGRDRQPRTARASASPSPTTIATGSWTCTSRTTRCSRSCIHNNGNGTFSEVGLLAGVGFNEDGKTFAGMGVDFADYDNDGRPDIIVTDLSNERYRLFRQNGDGSFRDVTNAVGRRRRHAALLGLEHALLRLRQRRLEGPLRRAGPRDGHDREDLAQSALPAAAAAAAERVGPVRPGHAGRRLPSRTGRAAAPRSATWTTTATSTSWSATSGQKAIVLRNDGGNRQQLARDPDGRPADRTATASGAAVKVVSAIRR